MKKWLIYILQTDKVVVMIFATLVAGAISEGRLKRKSSWVDYVFNNPGKWLCQLIMGQSIVLDPWGRFTKILRLRYVIGTPSSSWESHHQRHWMKRLWLVSISDEGSLPEIALSGASILASTYLILFYRSVHVLYWIICQQTSYDYMYI